MKKDYFVKLDDIKPFVNDSYSVFASQVGRGVHVELRMYLNGAVEVYDLKNDRILYRDTMTDDNQDNILSNALSSFNLYSNKLFDKTFTSFDVPLHYFETGEYVQVEKITAKVNTVIYPETILLVDESTSIKYTISYEDFLFYNTCKTVD